MKGCHYTLPVGKCCGWRDEPSSRLLLKEESLAGLRLCRGVIAFWECLWEWDPSPLDPLCLLQGRCTSSVLHEGGVGASLDERNPGRLRAEWRPGSMVWLSPLSPNLGLCSQKLHWLLREPCEAPESSYSSTARHCCFDSPRQIL